ncbi:hypothetical protein KP509_1Z068700 [Ceratopteris richardii]|nr:hypothetical protein KP509_1Z068700 [Ceratopteris richardii]
MEDKEVKKSSIKQDKKLKMSKSDALQDGNSDKKYVDENMEDKEVKKSSIKQDKKLKMSKSDALQDGVSDLGSSKSLDENLIITKAKKSKVSKSQLEGGSNAMSAETGTSMDLYPKQDDMQPKAKKKVKDNAPNEGQSSYKESGKKLSESHKEAASMSRKETFSKDTTIEDVSLQKGKEQMVVKKEKKSSGEGKKEDSKQFLQANISGTSKGKEKLNTLVMAPSTKAKKMEATKNEGEEVHQTIKKQKQSETKVQGIKKEAQKKVKVVNGALDSGQSNAQIEEEDEYDFMQDFSDLPTKFQDTALKVADHLGSNIQKFTDTSKTYFNKANQQISDSFSPIIGRQFAPFLASLLSYSFLLVPLAVVIVLFERIRVLFSIQKVLLFVNIYLAAYFATLLLATWIIGEPMNFFYRSSASGYVHLQLLQALGYIIYLILQTIDLASTLITEGMMIKVTTVLQWFVAFMIGFHYYVTVFHRAMALKGPHTNWKIYGTYSTTFLALCFFARIKRMKKSYVQFGQDDTDKRH